MLNRRVMDECYGQNSAYFCPNDPVTRAKIAEYIIKARNGIGFSMSVWYSDFNDIPFDHPQYHYIEKMYRDGITGGCLADNPSTPENERKFCPDWYVSRAQTAIFMLAALGQAPAASCTGMFNDVNAYTVGDTVCKYIEKFATMGFTAGCVADNPSTPQNERQFCPNDSVTKAQMAVFLKVGYPNP